MKKAPEEKIVRRRRRFLLVTAFLAFVMVCANAGQAQPTPFFPFAFDKPLMASRNERGMVVVDKNGSRILFLTSNEKLVNVLDLTTDQVPITEVSCIRQDGGDIFVAGAKRIIDGENVASESVLRFSVQGRLLNTVWHVDYQTDEVRANSTITDLVCKDNDVFVVQKNAADVFMSFGVDIFKIARSGATSEELRSRTSRNVTSLYDARYFSTQDLCILTDSYGILHSEQMSGADLCKTFGDWSTRKIGCWNADGTKALLYDVGSGELLRTDNVLKNAPVTRLDAPGPCKHVSLCDNLATATLDSGAVRVYDLASGQTHDLSEVSLTSLLNARDAAVIACGIYLVALCMVLLARWVIRTVRNGEHATVRHGIVVLAASLLCMVAATSHAFQTYNASLDSRERELLQIASCLCSASPDLLGDAAAHEAERQTGKNGIASNISEKAINEDLSLYRSVVSTVQTSMRNGMGVQCTAYALSADDKDLLCVSTSKRNVVLGSKVSDEELLQTAFSTIEKANEGEEFVGSYKVLEFIRENLTPLVSHLDTDSFTTTCIVPLFTQDGTCRAVMEVSYRTESFLHVLSSRLMANLLSFIMLAVAIFVVTEELLCSGRIFVRYQLFREQHAAWASSLLARPLNFVLNIVYGMDAALAIVFARDMLEAQGMNSEMFVWGIPALAIALGTSFGTLTHAFLAPRIPARTFALPLLLTTIAAQIACAFAVTNGWFEMFVGCKFITSAASAALIFVSKSLAKGVVGKELNSRQLSLDVSVASINVSGKGAAVAASVVGGFLASEGAQWVYVASAVVGVLSVLLLLMALPAGRVISSRGGRAGIRNVFGFLLTPMMLGTLVFAMLPVTLANGYRSYLLPLFLDSAGASKTDIANLFALGNVLLYAFRDTLIPQRNAHGRWRLSWKALVGLGVVFSLFAYNQTPVWAVVAIVAITILLWLANMWKRTARTWASADYGFSYEQSQATLETELALVRNAQAPILTRLLAFGTGTCCLALGVFFAFSGVAYYLITRKRGDFA